MKTIGLLGGMSWESTATYYRYINEAIRAKLGGLSSAKVLLNSLDFSQIVDLQQRSQWQQAGELLATAAAGLQNSGADCILICTNTMHLVADQVSASTKQIPLIDIITETATRLKMDGHKHVLLLATKYTMEHGFYHQRMAKLGIDVHVPTADDRITMQNIIFDELCRGEILPGSRQQIIQMVQSAKDSGINAVILGCTEIQLLVSPDDLPLPGYDSTRIHADAAVNFALS